MRTILKVFIFLICVIGNSQTEKKYIELESYSYDHKNFDDLEQLDNYFVNRKIIGIGESTHGTSEFTLMRHRIFKYLIRTHQFNTLFLEADFGACERINRYIQGEFDTIQKALDEVKLWPWRTNEMLEFIEWMRKYNENENYNKIEFIGIDMQLPKSNLIELKRRLIKVNSNYSDSLSKYLNNSKLIFDLSKRKEFTDLLSLIKNETNDSKINILITTINQSLNIDPKNNILKTANYRDSLMAYNILSYVKQKPTTKAIYFAHNGHVSKTNIRVDKFSNRKTSGWYLKKSLREKYFSIAQEFNQGTFNAKVRKKNKYQMEIVELLPSKKQTLGFYLSSYNKDILFSLKNWIPENIELMHHIGSAYINKKESYRKNVKFYDAFIFINNTSETKLNYDR